MGEPLACATMGRGYPSGERCAALLYAAATRGGPAKRPGRAEGAQPPAKASQRQAPRCIACTRGGGPLRGGGTNKKRQAGSRCGPPPRDYRWAPSVCPADPPRAAIARHRVTPICEAGYTAATRRQHAATADGAPSRGRGGGGRAAAAAAAFERTKNRRSAAAHPVLACPIAETAVEPPPRAAGAAAAANGVTACNERRRASHCWAGCVTLGPRTGGRGTPAYTTKHGSINGSHAGQSGEVHPGRRALAARTDGMEAAAGARARGGSSAPPRGRAHRKEPRVS